MQAADCSGEEVSSATLSASRHELNLRACCESAGSDRMSMRARQLARV